MTGNSKLEDCQQQTIADKVPQSTFFDKEFERAGSPPASPTDLGGSRPDLPVERKMLSFDPTRNLSVKAVR